MNFRTRRLGVSLIALLFTFSLFARAQNAPNQPPDDLPNPHQSTRDSIKRNNYITPLFELKALEEKYLASPQWRVSYLERIIQLEGYVGNYDEAYSYENLLYAEFPATKSIVAQYKNDIADLKSSPVANYQLLDAVAAIDAIAGKNQVVMINEEHRTPFHRALTLRSLEKLYAKGFRYFAAETVDQNDTKLNERGYPTQSTGYYTADPIYADVIRTALKLGYKVVPYESFDITCKAPENNPEFCHDRRERGQAQNLYERILKTDSQAKIFVHVGRGHNSKAETSKEFNFMGYYFKQLTGIEPFTIDQLRFSQQHSPALEQPLYRLLTKENMLHKPSVFQAADGKFYNQGNGYDMLVFHPRIRYQNGRATFLPMSGLRKIERINFRKLKLQTNKNIYAAPDPVLIQAFYSQESRDAVPADQIMLYPKREVPVLMLPQGKFRVRALDKAGTVLQEYETEVK